MGWRGYTVRTGMRLHRESAALEYDLKDSSSIDKQSRLPRRLYLLPATDLDHSGGWIIFVQRRAESTPYSHKQLECSVDRVGSSDRVTLKVAVPMVTVVLFKAPLML